MHTSDEGHIKKIQKQLLYQKFTDKIHDMILTEIAE